MHVHVTPGALRLSLFDPEGKRALGEPTSIGMELLERTIGHVAHDHDPTTRVAVGNPAERLSTFATSLGAEMVVVGSRRRRVSGVPARTRPHGHCRAGARITSRRRAPRRGLTAL